MNGVYALPAALVSEIYLLHHLGVCMRERVGGGVRV